MAVRLTFDALPLCFALILAGCTPAPQPHYLDIATTTSVQNSGLLEAVLPAFADATVRVHAAGSGRALEMLADQVVDLVIAHAPETEARYLAQHPDWAYRKVAYNHFVIVGPSPDPAAVRDATDAVDAFRRIARSPVAFVSRGDGSGTHEREQALWKEAGLAPAPDQFVISGRSMAIALRHAQERGGYTLSDDATFRQMQRQLDLVVLFQGDARLLNTYAVVYPRQAQLAAQFAEWLLRGRGRQLLANYEVGGEPAFVPWPAGCPDDSPRSQPCLGQYAPSAAVGSSRLGSRIVSECASPPVSTLETALPSRRPGSCLVLSINTDHDQ
ncbi:MAG TPA: substrate-binding domain-containing protein [Vicinamibacterales bacterium]|nr:substrate-binding domain-containing protein [Vicinamibacterales bacterium]